MELISGLAVGLIFGFLLKKSRFCPTGIIRDVYLEKRWYNIFVILSVIFTQSVIYFLLVKFEIITEMEFEDFSLVAIAVGSFMFGVGAVITNGCMTSSLVKFGDGRIIGILSVLVFMITGYISTNGFLAPATEKIGSLSLVEDNLLTKIPINPMFFSIPILIIVYIFLYKSYVKYKPKFKIPRRSSGLKYIFFEKIWPLELASILIGILMGLTYILSEHSCSRTGGIAISSPLMSWVYTFTNHEPLVSGGWNAYDQSFGWGSLEVLGIVLGSFIITFLSKEFRIVKTNMSTVIKTIIGSALMGVGAIWGQGCIIGNGLVATSQFSLKAWYAIIFLVLGIWVASRVTLKRKY